MSEIKNFRDLDAWRIGMDVVEAVYGLTDRFPDRERYGLISQMRRAAIPTMVGASAVILIVFAATRIVT